MAHRTVRRQSPAEGRLPGNRKDGRGAASAGVIFAHRTPWLRPFLLAGLAAVLVARPLFPSEGADLGDGVAVVMGLLGLSLLGLVFSIGRKTLRVRFSLIDLLIAVVILLHTVAAIRAVLWGTPRPALNLLWEWIGYAAIWFLARQLRLNQRERRTLLAGMVALAVGVAAYGIYQYAVEFPALREGYRLHRQDWLRSLGWEALESDPVRLALFENRLFSREPLATFALTNSLAGFLLPWTVVLGLILVQGVLSLARWVASRHRSVEGEVSAEGKNRSSGLAVVVAWFVAHHALIAWGIQLLGLLCCLMCLILTKSRSAYLGLLAAVLLCLGLVRLWPGRRWWLLPAGFAGLVAALVLGAVMAGGLDRQVLTEAGKSLGYRWQYWVATVHMIGDSPLFGCGPGNYRYEYTRYKLPEASEEIADPHNFVLELAATAGLPAAILFLAAFLLTLFRLARAAIGRSVFVDEEGFDNEGETRLAPQNRTGEKGRAGRESFFAGSRAALAGGGLGRSGKAAVLALLGGWVLGWPMGLLLSYLSSAPQTSTYLFVALPVGVATFWTLRGWVHNGRYPAVMTLAAITALAVHWLAAGGLGFPGVAYSFWLLWVLGLDQLEDQSRLVAGQATATQHGEQVGSAAAGGARDAIPVPGFWGYIAFAGLALITLLCYYTAYRPVLEARAYLAEAARLRMVPAQAKEMLLRAAEADPWAYEPWLKLVELWVQEGASLPTSDLAKREEAASTLESARRKQWEQELARYADKLLARAPNHYAVAWNLAVAYQELAEKTHDPAAMDRAVEWARRAVMLYPTEARYRAGLAEMALQTGKLEDARREAEQALWLHQVTPHADRKLPEETVHRLQETLRSRTSR